MDHLFTGCYISKEIWQTIFLLMGIREHFEQISFEETLQHWVEKYKNLRTLLIFVPWCIWSLKNRVIFKNSNICVFQQSTKIVSHSREYPSNQIQKNLRRIPFPCISQDLPVGFFDRAAQGNKFGEGRGLYSLESH